MQNLKEFEKSKGILAFATNTDDVDYISIANKTLPLASEVLGLPYKLVTDTHTTFTNKRYNIDTGDFIDWKNFNRCDAFWASPFDETIVIDVDYIVRTKNLLNIFKLDFDYLLARNNRFLLQSNVTTMGPRSLPFVWATVFAFRKTRKAEQFFKLVKRIQNNYNYYQVLFNVQERNFRNDYAFAIADIIINGYSISSSSIPGTIITVDTPIVSISNKEKLTVIKNKDSAFVVPQTDLHILSKQYLLDSAYTEFK